MNSRLSAPTIVFLAVSLTFGVALVFVTPPFQVPDEVGHFWHAYALGRGDLNPPVQNGRAVVTIPEGSRKLVATLWVVPGTRTKFNERLQAAARLPYLVHEHSVTFPAFYSPLPYLPQAFGCFVGDRLHLRPLVTFYLGRLFGLLIAIGIITTAIQASEDSAVVIATVGLLPMALYLFASYSADAMTIALASLATVLARKPGWSFYVTALLIALCKPPYLLVVLLAFASRRRRAATLAAIAAFAGMALSLTFSSAALNSTRPDADPRAQLSTFTHDPLHAMAAASRDLRQNARDRVDELVGRLGWLDIPIPRPAHYAMIAALLFVAAVGGSSASASERLAAAGIVVLCVFLIELSQWIIWTPPGRMAVEGVQGRYFIPLLPMFFVAVSHRERRVTFAPVLVGTAAFVANAGALAVVWQRYYV